MEEKRRTPQLPWPEWKIEGLLGRGGFGDVYRIRREEYGNVSLAALKVVRIPADESEIQELEANGISVGSYYKGMISDLLKEISLMESLKAATNVVTIDDYKIIEKKDSVGWVLFIRMELLTNLNVYRKSHVMSVKEVVKLGFDICSALEACQKKGIVHRDIKPSNILVSEFGDFKLGDFGISRNLTHTMSGLSRKGTELYMAPEVYRGNKYNATVDIYSLGLVLYSLLNHGRLPFFPRVPAEVTKNDSINAFSKRMRGEVFPDPDEGGREIGDVLRKACHIDPKMRYQSAAEFKGALINCQSREMTDARQHYAVHKQQVPAQSFIESEETISDVSIIKENTPVIKTEYKEKHQKKKTKGSRKYAVLVIGLLAVVCVAGAVTLQKKRNSQVVFDEWKQVYNTLDEMTSQGVFEYMGKTSQELEEYLFLESGSVGYYDGAGVLHYEYPNTNEQVLISFDDAGKMEMINICKFDKEDGIDLGTGKSLKIANSREEIFNLLGITSEMTEWLINKGEQDNSSGETQLSMQGFICEIQQKSVHKGINVYDAHMTVGTDEKIIDLRFDNDENKSLKEISVQLISD